MRGVLAILVFGAGLALSGSRSGVLIAVGSLLLFGLTRRTPRPVRVVGLLAGAALVLLLVLMLLRASPGSIGGRIAEMFDPSLPVKYHVSARPILWSAAFRLFAEHPLAGAGIGAFNWRLPDLLRERSVRVPFRDNPGSAYFQALAETGILGFALTLVFVVTLGRDCLRRLAAGGGDATSTASALAVLAFLAVLAVGSHWLGADTGLFFFLLASVAAERAPAGRAAPSRRWWFPAAVLLYALAAFGSALATARPDEAFRYGSRIGFYPPEGGVGGHQWTRQNFALRLWPGESQRLALAHFSPVGKPVEIEVREAGHLLFRKSLAPGRSIVLRLRAGATRPVVLRFALSRSFVPKRLGIPGGDARQLGLQAVFLGR